MCKFRRCKNQNRILSPSVWPTLILIRIVSATLYVFLPISVSFSVSSLPRGDALTPPPRRRQRRRPTTCCCLLLLYLAHIITIVLAGWDGRTDDGSRLGSSQTPRRICCGPAMPRHTDGGTTTATDGQRSREGESQPGLRAVSRLESRVSWMAQHYMEPMPLKTLKLPMSYHEKREGFLIA